jgi:hypothetical protein
VRVAGEAVEEPAHLLAQQRVYLDLLLHAGKFGAGRQFAVDQQMGDLKERRALGELVDRVAPVAQHAGVASM